MGVKNQQNYKPTNHFAERAKERFQIPNVMEAKKFFDQQAPKLNFVGTQIIDKKKREQWKNDDYTFILDPSNFKIVTVYSSGDAYMDSKYQMNKRGEEVTNKKDEQSSGNTLSMFGINSIVGVLEDEMFGNTEQTLEKMTVFLDKIAILSKKMKNTKRHDYLAKQSEEAETLLKEMTHMTTQLFTKNKGVKTLMTQITKENTNG